MAHRHFDPEQELWHDLMIGVDTSKCSSPHEHCLLYEKKLVEEVFRLRKLLVTRSQHAEIEKK